MDAPILDFKGIVATIILGVIVFFAGVSYGLFFVLCLVVFLILATVVTRIGRPYKHRLVEYKHARSFENVLANGGGPLIMAIFFLFAYLAHSNLLETLAVIGFVCSIAAITADKFESEIGILAGRPLMITTMKKVKKGTSGGVTSTGLAAGLFASFLIALLVLIAPIGVLNLSSIQLLSIMILIITLSGFLGSIIDSVLGSFEERGIGNKFSSNFVCGLVGAVTGIALFVVIVML